VVKVGKCGQKCVLYVPLRHQPLFTNTQAQLNPILGKYKQFSAFPTHTHTHLETLKTLKTTHS